MSDASDREDATDQNSGPGETVYMACEPVPVPEPVTFPPGFGIRTMTLADVPTWTAIQRDAEPYLKIQDDLFVRSFGTDEEAIGQRCHLITGPDGQDVGTISAWWNPDFRGKAWGQLHWLAVRPAHQGKGLARAGTAVVVRELAQWHPRAYLGTHAKRLGAIHLYLQFGFQPLIDSERERDIWDDIRARLAARDTAGPHRR